MGLYQENVLNSLRDSLMGKTNTICTGKQALSSLKSLEILRLNYEYRTLALLGGERLINNPLKNIILLAKKRPRS